MGSLRRNDAPWLTEPETPLRESTFVNADRIDQRPAVLYLENNPDDFLLMQLAIRQSEAPIQLHWVDDSASARHFLLGQAPFSNRHRYPDPALVLIDFLLRNESGLDFLRWLRQQPQPHLASVTAVMFSDSDHGARFDQSYASGAQYCLVKPNTFERVLAIVACLNRCLHAQPAAFDELQRLPEYRQPGATASTDTGATERGSMAQVYRSLGKRSP